MLKTLHVYIWRDLLRIAGLALVAFTLVMTIFAMVDLSRRHSLTTGQAGMFFMYTIPVMLSLTMPVAALFAATIVYGRFSQDNELMACRASGIGTARLMAPAILLGAIVTAASLLLDNFVAPRLAAAGEAAVRANLRTIAYHSLSSEGSIGWQKFLLHADKVYPESDAMGGVVFLDGDDPQQLRILVASKAFVDFGGTGQSASFSVDLRDVEVVRSTADRMQEIFWAASQKTPPVELPSQIRYKSAFFDWRQLLTIMQRPASHPEVAAALEGLQRSLTKTLVAEEVAAAINRGQPYELSDSRQVYKVSAGRAEVAQGRAKLFPAKRADGTDVPVSVDVLQGGKLKMTLDAPGGAVEADWVGQWARASQPWLVGIVLTGPVMVRSGGLDAEPRRHDTWQMGEGVLPQGITQRAAAIALAAMQPGENAAADRPDVAKNMHEIRDKLVPRILGGVVAEMHSRLAYSVSCFLLVALGAALGLIFKGGQVISAFTLSVMPAAGVIVLILMGKQLVSNPDAPSMLGLAAIWLGVVLLVVTDVIVYAGLSRR